MEGVGGKVALITGGNSGIGLALAERLLFADGNITVCLGCRNEARATAARHQLLKQLPRCKVDILIIDVAKLSSVRSAAAELKNSSSTTFAELCTPSPRLLEFLNSALVRPEALFTYGHIDYLFMNAGILPVSTVDWGHFWKTFFSTAVIHMFRTGDGLLRQPDGSSPDGLKEIFATNAFGHFVLLKELDGTLGGSDGDTQIIWTSSMNAKKETFSLDDIQHQHGHEPYGSSKYLLDMISVAINQTLNSQGIYSHTTCPGLVMTQLTYSVMPSWFWTLIFPFLWLMRVVEPGMTVTPLNGSEALFWLSQQDPASLDPHSKYQSCVSLTGDRCTKPAKMDIDVDIALETYKKLSEMEEEMR